jgi:hypothetical protein
VGGQVLGDIVGCVRGLENLGILKVRPDLLQEWDKMSFIHWVYQISWRIVYKADFSQRIYSILENLEVFITMALRGLLSSRIPSSCGKVEHAESVLKKDGSVYLFKHAPSPPISYLRIERCCNRHGSDLLSCPTHTHTLEIGHTVLVEHEELGWSATLLDWLHDEARRVASRDNPLVDPRIRTPIDTCRRD